MDWLSLLRAQLRQFAIRHIILTDLRIRLVILKYKRYAHLYKNYEDIRKIFRMMALLLVTSTLSLILGIKQWHRSYQVSLHPEIQMREAHQYVRDDFPELALAFVEFERCMDGIISPTLDKCDTEVSVLVGNLGQRIRYAEYKAKRTDQFDWIQEVDKHGRHAMPKPKSESVPH